MSIHLPKTRRDLTLLTAGELARLLNIPESQMQKALRAGIVRPLGTVGRATLIAVTEEEMEDLQRHFHPPAP